MANLYRPAVAAFAISLLMVAPVYAQQSPASPAHPIDFTLVGAPMPPLQFMSYRDTAMPQVQSGKRRHGKGEQPAQTGTYTLVNGNELARGANLLVMIFSPDCKHCNETTSVLEQNMGSFKKSAIVLLTTTKMMETLPAFAARHNTRNYTAMHVGYDSSQFVNNTFLYRPLPQINVYSADRKLIKTFTGEIPVDSLKKYIE